MRSPALFGTSGSLLWAMLLRPLIFFGSCLLHLHHQLALPVLPHQLLQTAPLTWCKPRSPTSLSQKPLTRFWNPLSLALHLCFLLVAAWLVLQPLGNLVCEGLGLLESGLVPLSVVGLPPLNRSPQLAQEQVLRSCQLPGPISGPTIFKSAHSYWRAIGTTLANSPSISHAFPSELEAKIYLQAAGHLDFETVQ